MAAMTNHARLSRKSPGTANGRLSRAATNAVLVDLDGARQDAGISLRRLAAACGVSQSHLSLLFAGDREPSISVLTALSTALGGRLSMRFYPSTGPQIHDRVQSPIVEELLRIAAPTWARSVEVQVTRPARGFIDLVLDSKSLATTVAGEVESKLPRLEQSLRWAHEKASSLPSSDLWQFSDGERTVRQLLVLRSTSATRDIARRFEAMLRTAYPARTADVFASLTTADTPWPDHGILWADLHGDTVRILDRPPRGIELGR
jgi:transcriptional regulator with XRE-family HTH domain